MGVAATLPELSEWTLHIGACHSTNCQIVLKLFGYDIFCNNLQDKRHFKQIWRYHRSQVS